MLDIQERVQKLEPGRIIELFRLDLTNLGGDILHFHSSISQGYASIVFDGEEYIPYPVEASGWEITGNGQLPRPKLRVSNVESNITALMQRYNNLRRAEVTRIRTFFEYTDGQPEADPTQHFPEDVFYVSNKTGEDETQVEFELRAAPDIQGVFLPRGQVLAHACQHVYRGPRCQYTLENFFDRNETYLNGTTNPQAWSGQANYNTGDFVYIVKDNAIKFYKRTGAPVLGANPLTDGGWIADNTPATTKKNRNDWKATKTYALGDYVYVLTNGVRRYYVCTGPTVKGLPPMMDAGFTSDTCAKKTVSCKNRCGVQFEGVLNTSAFVGTFKLPA